MKKVKGVGAVVNGNPLHSTFELPVATAERLEKQGIVEIIGDVKPVKAETKKATTTTKKKEPAKPKKKATDKTEK